ncbi:MAG: NAD(P)-dependent oxidoreductase [Armatimonadota bacterium]|nr:NAD(P)-dependent oxidoreductase [Armatimonadota bacterium]
MSALRIGWAGVGAMGLPMARNLLARGFAVTVLRHRGAHGPAALAAAGAAIADSLAGLSAASDVVVLMLPSSREVEEVVLGAGGLESTLRPGRIVVDMGTSDPGSTRRLAAHLAARGVDLVDAPVTGGTRGAADATLVIMAGGLAPAVERVRPVLEAMGRVVVHVGGVGAGHTLKLVNNLIALSGAAIVAEALRLAQTAGLSLPVVLDVLQQGSADSAILRGMAGRLRAGRFEPGFKIELARKDLVLAGRLAEALGVPLSLGAAARRVFDRACEAGRAHLDTAALAEDITRA